MLACCFVACLVCVCIVSILTCSAGYIFSCGGVPAPIARNGSSGCTDGYLCYHRNNELFWFPNMALQIGSCIKQNNTNTPTTQTPTTLTPTTQTPTTAAPTNECADVVPAAPGEVWTRVEYNFQGGNQDCNTTSKHNKQAQPAQPHKHKHKHKHKQHHKQHQHRST